VDPSAPLGALDAAGVRRYWDEVLTVVRRRGGQKPWAVVREAAVRDVHGDEIVLLFRHSVHAEMLGAQTEVLLDALHEVLGGRWRVRPEIGGDERTRATPAPETRTTGEPAQSGGAQPAPSAPAGDDGWPEAARPGGRAATPAAPARSAARAARPAARGSSAVRPDDAPPFDPGDEPFDDEGPVARQSSEEQALLAVTEHFAVERIGDTGPR
jgi:DNA polymerase-3 subunit gamma/tau